MVAIRRKWISSRRRKIYAAALVLAAHAWILGACNPHPSGPDLALLDRTLQEQFGSEFGFSVAIGTDSGVIFSGTYGFVDSARSEAVTDATLFNVASITKSLTALLAYRLAERGRLHLADSLAAFMNDVPDDKRPITIHHLLSHTSGYPQHYVCDDISDADSAWRALRADTLQFEPGTDFAYSNENFELLALIVERVTGERFEDVLRRDVLSPAGMNRTLFWKEAGDTFGSSGAVTNPPGRPLSRNWGYIGSGGLYSNPSDLYALWLAVKNHTLISEASTRSMLASYYRTSSGTDICHGWFGTDSTAWGTREIWTRGSESWGPNAILRWFPERATVILVCTNSGERGDRHTTGNRLVSDYIADFLWK